MRGTHCKIVQTMNSTETVKKSLEFDYFKVKVLTNAEWGRVVPAPHGSWHTWYMGVALEKSFPAEVKAGGFSLSTLNSETNHCLPLLLSLPCIHVTQHTSLHIYLLNKALHVDIAVGIQQTWFSKRQKLSPAACIPVHSWMTLLRWPCTCPLFWSRWQAPSAPDRWWDQRLDEAERENRCHHVWLGRILNVAHHKNVWSLFLSLVIMFWDLCVSELHSSYQIWSNKRQTHWRTLQSQLDVIIECCEQALV